MSTSIDELWPIPAGLSADGLAAAQIIRTFLVEKRLEQHHGGGKFYTPQQWADRDEKYGLSSELIITHDGGDHALAIAPYLGEASICEQLQSRMREQGLHIEECTSWYSAVYRL